MLEITQEVVGFAADVLLLTFKTRKEVPLNDGRMMPKKVLGSLLCFDVSLSNLIIIFGI